VLYKLPKPFDTIDTLEIDDINYLNLVYTSFRNGHPRTAISTWDHGCSFYIPSQDGGAEIKNVQFPFKAFRKNVSLSQRDWTVYRDDLYRLPNNRSPFDILYIGHLGHILISSQYDLQIFLDVSKVSNDQKTIMIGSILKNDSDMVYPFLIPD